jgi:hypothetical protein
MREREEPGSGHDPGRVGTDERRVVHSALHLHTRPLRPYTSATEALQGGGHTLVGVCLSLCLAVCPLRLPQ